MSGTVRRALPYGAIGGLLLLMAVFFLVPYELHDWGDRELAKVVLVDLPIGIIAGCIGGFIFLLWMSSAPALTLGDIIEKKDHFKVRVQNDRKKAWFLHEAASNILEIHAEMHIVSSTKNHDPERSVRVPLNRDSFPVLQPTHPQTFVTHDSAKSIQAKIGQFKTQWTSEGRNVDDIGLRFFVSCRDGFSNVPALIEKWKKP